MIRYDKKFTNEKKIVWVEQSELIMEVNEKKIYMINANFANGFLCKIPSEKD